MTQLTKLHGWAANCQRLGVSRPTIHRWLREAGIRTTRRNAIVENHVAARLSDRLSDFKNRAHGVRLYARSGKNRKYSVKARELNFLWRMCFVPGPDILALPVADTGPQRDDQMNSLLPKCGIAPPDWSGIFHIATSAEIRLLQAAVLYFKTAPLELRNRRGEIENYMRARAKFLADGGTEKSWCIAVVDFNSAWAIDSGVAIMARDIQKPVKLRVAYGKIAKLLKLSRAAFAKKIQRFNRRRDKLRNTGANHFMGTFLFLRMFCLETQSENFNTPGWRDRLIAILLDLYRAQIDPSAMLNVNPVGRRQPIDPDKIKAKTSRVRPKSERKKTPDEELFTHPEPTTRFCDYQIGRQPQSGEPIYCEKQLQIERDGVWWCEVHGPRL